jgi:hypothetical protein
MAMKTSVPPVTVTTCECDFRTGDLSVGRFFLDLTCLSLTTSLRIDAQYFIYVDPSIYQIHIILANNVFAVESTSYPRGGLEKWLKNLRARFRPSISEVSINLGSPSNSSRSNRSTAALRSSRLRLARFQSSEYVPYFIRQCLHRVCVACGNSSSGIFLPYWSHWHVCPGASNKRLGVPITDRYRADYFQCAFA